MGQWFSKTPDEVRAALASTNTVMVMFACKKGRAEKMLKAPANYRFPSKWTPLVEGTVEAISRDGTRIKVSDGVEREGWIDFADVLFYFDVL